MTEPDFNQYNRQHGTMSGYCLHQIIGTPPCEACRKAKHEYNMQRKATNPKTQKNLSTTLARYRALARLSRRYPEEYRVLYEEEKLIAFAEADAPEDTT
jgi:hypothetical protein